jgi:hypothetical protein
MALTAPTGGNAARQIAPEGLYPARCYQIIDLGTSEQGGNFPGKKRKVQFLFELPTEKAVFNDDKGEQPYYVRSIYTLSMNEKALLRRDVSAWIGKKMTDGEASKFDIFTLLGKTCMVNVTHVTKGDNTYANIMSITPMPKGLTCPEPINEAFVYSPTEHSQETFAKLPEFVQDKIKESDEYIKMTAANFKNDFTPKTQPPANFEQLPDIDDIFGQKAANDLPWD